MVFWYKNTKWFPVGRKTSEKSDKLLMVDIDAQQYETIYQTQLQEETRNKGKGKTKWLSRMLLYNGE